MRIHFDSRHYRKHYSDISGKTDLLAHFCEIGWRERRNPSPDFDTTFYLDTYNDILKADINPFRHYLLQRGENRLPKSVNKNHANCWQCDIMRDFFNPKYYRARYPDLIDITDPLMHYCETGWKEFRNPSIEFDTEYYLNINKDVLDAKINPFVHYLSQSNEGRLPKSIEAIQKKILKAARSINNVSKYYKNIIPNISFLDTSILLLKLFELNKICVSISHDDYMIHTGGVQQFIKYESSVLKEDGFSYLNIHPAMPNNKIIEGNAETLLVNCYLNNLFVGTFTVADIVNVFQKLKTKRSIFHTGVIHSIMGWNISAIIEIFKIEFKQTFFYTHDYYSLCHEYRLLRNNLVPCDAPSYDSVSCSICIHKAGREHHLNQYERLFNELHPKFIFPSKAAETVFKNAKPAYHLKSVVIPHIRVVKADLSNGEINLDEEDSKTLTGPIRIAFCGQPTSQKGYLHFIELAENCLTLDDIEFFHFGSESGHLPHINFVEAKLTSGISQMSHLLSKYKIDIVFVPSIWRETFNFVAYEAVKAGAALITLDKSGNVSDFVSTYKIGVVVAGVTEATELVSRQDFRARIIEWKQIINNLSFIDNRSFQSISEQASE